MNRLSQVLVAELMLGSSSAIMMPTLASAGPQCSAQTVDAQGKRDPDKQIAIELATRAWQRRVKSVLGPTYTDHTKAQNWTVNCKQDGNEIFCNVAGIPCE